MATISSRPQCADYDVKSHKGHTHNVLSTISTQMGLETNLVIAILSEIDLGFAIYFWESIRPLKS